MESGMCESSIAIVDDERVIVEFYKKVFESMKVRVSFVAYDGREAVIKFEQCDPRPQVVLMDFRMPIMDGVEAAREILKITPATRVIFISADSGVREEALKAGAISFIQKPVSLKEIVAHVETVLR